MIDLDMMPPDWKFAQNHAKANKPGLVEDILNPNSSNVFCPCCLKPIIKSDIPLLNNSKQLEFMGFGFPLYFIFIKYCIILLLILICSYNVISIYWAITSNEAFCHRRLLAGGGTQAAYCTSVFVKWSRIEKVVSAQELIMRITSFCIHLFALLYIRDNIMKTLEYYDERTTSLSDYSLIIKNLPMKDGIQKGIKDFINKHFSQKWDQLKKISGPEFLQETKVMQITLLPQIQDFYKLQEQKHTLIEEKRALLKQQQNSQGRIPRGGIQQTESFQKQSVLQLKIRNTNEKLGLINKNISQISTKYRNLAKQDKLHSSKAIVTLNSQLIKSTIMDCGDQNPLDSNNLNQYFGQFEGELQIIQAPQPNQIIWQNVNRSPQKLFFGKLLGWALTLIFIAIVTIGFYIILNFKTKYLLAAISESDSTVSLSSSVHYRIAVFLVFFDIILIVLFNKLVMGSVLHYFTTLQKHAATSDQEFSFALKYTLGLFFTTALMTLAVEAVTFKNFYSHQFGVIEQESIMFFINAFLIPIIWLINPWQLVKRIVRKFKVGKKYYTQRQANEILCETPYTIGKRYAEIVETLWFTFLYATLIPMGAFLTIVGLSIYYWIDKYNLLKRSSLNHNISGDMALVSLKLLDFTLVLKPLGQLIFDYSIRSHIQIESIVLVSLGLIYLVLPVDKILEFLHPEEFQPEEKTFADVKDNFLQTYQTMHPILSFKALKVFDNLKKKLTNNEITLNEIEVSDIQIDMTMKEFPFKSDKVANVSIYQPTSQNKIGLRTYGNQEAQQQFLNYQYRTKKVKNASKSYFSNTRRKDSQTLFQ